MEEDPWFITEVYNIRLNPTEGILQRYTNMGAFVCTVISLKGPTKEATSVSHLLSAVKEHQLSRAMRYLHTKLDTLPKWKQISSRKQKLKQASSGKEGVKSEEGNKIEPKTAKDDQDPKIAIAEQGGQLVEGENDLDHLNERMEEMALELKDHNDAVGLDGTVSHFPLEEWETVTLSDPVAVLARTAVFSSSIQTHLFSRERWIKDRFYFGTRLSTFNKPISDQSWTERCWLFTCTNILRHHISKASQLSYDSSQGFQFSLSYLSFYDKLEKANCYLENMIEMAQLPLDDRLVNRTNSSPMVDGGYWRDAVWLVKKYGLVPEDIFPESTSSSDTSTMNEVLHTKTREHALRLRELDTALRRDVRFAESSDPEVQRKSDQGRLKILRQMKSEYLQEIYNILTVCMGVPPSPTDSFVWERYDKDKDYTYWTGTPIDFLKTYVSHTDGNSDPLDTISLANDPRYEYGKVLINERRGNYIGSKSSMQLNVPSEVMKTAVVKSLQADLPAAFACDINQFASDSEGILDIDIYQYEKVFGTKFGLTKGERLETGDSWLSHDMIFTATHLNEEGHVVRFQVENSWGRDFRDEGHFLMTPAWFDQFVYQVAIPRSVAEREFKHLVDSLSTADKCVLPFWDPMD